MRRAGGPEGPWAWVSLGWVSWWLVASWRTSYRGPPPIRRMYSCIRSPFGSSAECPLAPASSLAHALLNEQTSTRPTGSMHVHVRWPPPPFLMSNDDPNITTGRQLGRLCAAPLLLSQQQLNHACVWAHDCPTACALAAADAVINSRLTSQLAHPCATRLTAPSAAPRFVNQPPSQVQLPAQRQQLLRGAFWVLCLLCLSCNECRPFSAMEARPRCRDATCRLPLRQPPPVLAIQHQASITQATVCCAD